MKMPSIKVPAPNETRETSDPVLSMLGIGSQLWGLNREIYSSNGYDPKRRCRRGSRLRLLRGTTRRWSESESRTIIENHQGQEFRTVEGLPFTRGGGCRYLVLSEWPAHQSEGNASANGEGDCPLPPCYDN